jgi:hypothetical protein
MAIKHTLLFAARAYLLQESGFFTHVGTYTHPFQLLIQDVLTYFSCFPSRTRDSGVQSGFKILVWIIFIKANS